MVKHKCIKKPSERIKKCFSNFIFGKREDTGIIDFVKVNKEHRTRIPKKDMLKEDNRYWYHRKDYKVL